MFYLVIIITNQITSGEYIQMSGRAGRRGIDERGMVMMMVDQKLDSLVGKNILKVQYYLMYLSYTNECIHTNGGGRWRLEG